MRAHCVLFFNTLRRYFRNCDRIHQKNVKVCIYVTKFISPSKVRNNWLWFHRWEQIWKYGQTKLKRGAIKKKNVSKDIAFVSFLLSLCFSVPLQRFLHKSSCGVMLKKSSIFCDIFAYIIVFFYCKDIVLYKERFY